MKNLKFLIILSAFIFAGISANAQAIGFKAGGTFSQIISDPDLKAADMGIKPGVQFGVIVSMMIFPMLDIQPEVIVYQKGVSYKGETLGVSYESNTNIYSVDVPINIRFKPPVLPIYVIAGPYIGYSLQGTTYYKLDNLILTDNEPITFDKEGFHQFDFGVDAGLGFMKDIGPLHFFIEARYNYGLADINGYKGILGTENYVSKNTNIGIAAGVLLGFK